MDNVIFATLAMPCQQIEHPACQEHHLKTLIAADSKMDSAYSAPIDISVIVLGCVLPFILCARISTQLLGLVFLVTHTTSSQGQDASPLPSLILIVLPMKEMHAVLVHRDITFLMENANK